jgi:hypothetical protein
MTQTLIPMTAIVSRSFTSGVLVAEVPMTSVEAAREEFGVTLADAEAFVQDTACTECGLSREEADLDGRSCQNCGIGGCDCILSESDHVSDLFFCADCNPCVFCPSCNA